MLRALQFTMKKSVPLLSSNTDVTPHIHLSIGLFYVLLFSNRYNEFSHMMLCMGTYSYSTHAHPHLELLDHCR